VKALLLTNEYPPHVYGGAGVHVDYLSRALATVVDVEVRCFGDQERHAQRLRVRGYGTNDAVFAATPRELRGALQALDRCVGFTATPIDADVVHCHTWYTCFAGVVAKLAYGTPLVVTTHSLEPLRQWKREQLGRGYDLAAWLERSALQMADRIIAVSGAMRDDIERLFAVEPRRITVVHNGVDPDEYRRVATQAALHRYGIDAQRPYVLFVGRITRQKGILHLVRAIEHLTPGVQVVLCAGAPDTDEIARATAAAVRAVQGRRGGVVWIAEMVDRHTAVELYSHAAVFCCPSVYEPFGIINLEAMACEVPVVATAVGGIPEVVRHGDTGLLVELDARGDSGEPRDAERFARALAAALNQLLGDAAMRRRMGAAGRARVLHEFAWDRVARRVVGVYEDVVRAAGTSK
jgi:glycogen synthase